MYRITTASLVSAFREAVVFFATVGNDYSSMLIAYAFSIVVPKMIFSISCAVS